MFPRFRVAQFGALLAAAIAGGAVALLGAAAFGVGDKTTTVTPALGEFSLPAQRNVSEQAPSNRPLTIHEIYRRAAPGVVQISTTSVVHLAPDPFGFGFGGGTQTERSLGSGFVMDKAGHILTNYHVIAHARTIDVSFSNADSMRAKLVGADPSTDIAVLKINAHSRALSPLRLGNSDQVEVGDSVAAIGNPLGFDRSITAGIVSALQREIQAPNGYAIEHVIQTDAQINKGNSGGPLLNTRGEVIGINSQIATAGGGDGNIGIGFAVPINTAKNVAAQLIKTGRVQHALLGVKVQTVTPRLANAFGLPASHGVLVAEVTRGSGADAAGLKGGTYPVVFEGESYRLGGDLIVKVDGVPIQSDQDLRDLIATKRPGDHVKVEYYRRGVSGKQEANVKLGRQPNSPPP